MVIGGKSFAETNTFRGILVKLFLAGFRGYFFRAYLTTIIIRVFMFYVMFFLTCPNFISNHGPRFVSHSFQKWDLDSDRYINSRLINTGYFQTSLEPVVPEADDDPPPAVVRR